MKVHMYDDIDVIRVVMAMVLSTYGLPVMVAVTVIAATVMGTQTVFTHCPSAVLRRMVMYHGTRRRAHQLLPVHTAAALEPSDRL